MPSIYKPSRSPPTIEREEAVAEYVSPTALRHSGTSQRPANVGIARDRCDASQPVGDVSRDHICRSSDVRGRSSTKRDAITGVGLVRAKPSTELDRRFDGSLNVIHPNSTGERFKILKPNNNEGTLVAGRAPNPGHRDAASVPDIAVTWDWICECVIVGLRHCNCTCSYVHPDIIDGGEEQIDE